MLSGPNTINLFLQSLPGNGIKVFAGLPHTHGLGTSVRLRHIRSGVERPVPFQDRFYDPNYQTMRRFEFDLKPVSLDVQPPLTHNFNHLLFPLLQ